MPQKQTISSQLNDLLVSKNFHPEMRDRSGALTTADNAKTFTFDYVSSRGRNYGTMVVILDSDNDLKAFYGDNLGRAMEGPDKEELFQFQQQLSRFANSRQWTYTGTDLSKLKYTMQGMAAIREGLFEGYYGTRTVSYSGRPTEARLMIRHSRPLGESDARYRHVESIYIETADSERFRLPFKSMVGARAMLEHVKQGGRPYDARGIHISEMVHEAVLLSRFHRVSERYVAEGITQQLIEQSRDYYAHLRTGLRQLSSPRGYQQYFESWHPADIDPAQELVEDIKQLFVEQSIDSRIEAALPVLAKIKDTSMKEADIFESWANRLVEGTWAMPETPEQLKRLQQLMSEPLPVGPDATNATELLYDILGDDRLFDQLEELAAQDPDADARETVQARLEELGISIDNTDQSDTSAQTRN